MLSTQGMGSQRLPTMFLRSLSFSDSGFDIVFSGDSRKGRWGNDERVWGLPRGTPEGKRGSRYVLTAKAPAMETLPGMTMGSGWTLSEVMCAAADAAAAVGKGGLGGKV